MPVPSQGGVELAFDVAAFKHVLLSQRREHGRKPVHLTDAGGDRARLWAAVRNHARTGRVLLPAGTWRGASISFAVQIAVRTEMNTTTKSYTWLQKI